LCGFRLKLKSSSANTKKQFKKSSVEPFPPGQLLIQLYLTFRRHSGRRTKNPEMQSNIFHFHSQRGKSFSISPENASPFLRPTQVTSSVANCVIRLA